MPRTRSGSGPTKPRIVRGTPATGYATWPSAASMWRKICATPSAKKWNRCGGSSTGTSAGLDPRLAEDGGEEPFETMQKRMFVFRWRDHRRFDHGFDTHAAG